MIDEVDLKENKGIYYYIMKNKINKLKEGNEYEKDN